MRDPLGNLMTGYLEVTVNYLQCGTILITVTNIMSNKETTLEKIFQEDYIKLSKLMGNHDELKSIVGDLLECHAALYSNGHPGGKTHLLKEHYLELLEDLKEEVLQYLNKIHYN